MDEIVSSPPPRQRVGAAQIMATAEAIAEGSVTTSDPADYADIKARVLVERLEGRTSIEGKKAVPGTSDDTSLETLKQAVEEKEAKKEGKRGKKGKAALEGPILSPGPRGVTS